MANTNRRYLSFDFVKDNIKDPIINFSRGSTKTIIDKNTGLVRTLAVNVPAAFDDACGRQELWKAGSKNLCSYSNDLTNSSWDLHTALASRYADVTRVDFSAGDSYCGKYVNLTVGTTYTVSAKVKSATGVAQTVAIEWQSTSSYVSVSTDWVTIQRTAVAPSGAQYFAFRCNSAGAGSLLIKEVQIEVGSAATAYEPNPVVIQPGFLIEGAATNYLPYSIPSGNWGASAGVSFTENYATAPDGTNTATRIQYNGSGAAGSYRAYGNADMATAGQKRVSSFWIKANSGTPTILLNNNQSVYGTITLTSNWRRYYLPDSGNAGSSWQPLIYSQAGDNSPFDISVWGVQLDDGQFPSSNIPTNGAAVTRSADVATVDVSKIWNASEGTIVCEADFGQLSGAYNVAFLANNDCMDFYRAPDNRLTVKSGYLVFGNRTGRARCSQAYSQGAVKASLNGEALIQVSQPVLPPVFLYIGCDSAGEQLNGTIQQFTYMPFAFDDITLKASSVIKG